MALAGEVQKWPISFEATIGADVLHSSSKKRHHHCAWQQRQMRRQKEKRNKRTWGDCLTLGDQSQSQPITFPGSANCPMKHLAEKFMSGAARTLQVWGNEGGTLTCTRDIHDGIVVAHPTCHIVLESRLSLDSGNARGCHKNSKNCGLWLNATMPHTAPNAASI